ncbi:Glucoside xylosyltransferase 2 [Orchesella cincta]|uniref:UDP-D-xylose:beta-D-glucoside alpha-1,3-D-xylosyltransferase n=1 Tax=Orchesella cincta TaxID=48709 RepID=A0A1D2MG05_ORCCI|nr:Glucoside xylosyltransferase 2 [Orchesella cincta]
MECNQQLTRKFKRGRIVKLILLIAVVSYIVLHLLSNRSFPNTVQHIKTVHENGSTGQVVSSTSESINIAIVSCDHSGNSGSATLASVMIKSVLISAERFHASSVHFFIFLEEAGTQKFIENNVKEYGYSNGNKSVGARLHFHSVFDVVPKEHHRNFVISPAGPRCTFIRLFLSSYLLNVDQILYLDTDTIVTGDISKVWSHFKEMNAQQLIGIAPNSQPGPDFDNIHKTNFGGYPHVPPKGVNAGVVLMNLRKMRTIDWNQKILRAYNNYSTVYNAVNDQLLLNIYLHYETGSRFLNLMPCKYNYMHVYCDHGQLCESVEEDAVGIHIVHGSGGQFFNKEKGLYPVHQVFKKVNISSQHILKELRMSLQQNFVDGANKPECYKHLNRLFSKSFS